MVPYGKNAEAALQRFDTKREVLVLKKGALTTKHFMHEKESDWVNPNHENWGFNPSIGLKKTKARIFVTIDRLFYYAGDKITI